MAHNTEIGWTHVPGYRGETWNPWTGCTKVSPGCAHCYIEDTPPFRKIGIRFENGKIPITLYPDRFRLPIGWKKPRAIFVNSMSDLFHEDVDKGQIAKVFAVAALAPRHIYMVLTKRPERMRELVGGLTFRADVEQQMYRMRSLLPRQEQWNINKRMSHIMPLIYDHEWPLRSVWLGVSIENRRMVHRADLLRQTPAAVRFISAEPLLGPLIPAINIGELAYDGERATVEQRRVQTEFEWDDGHVGPGLNLTDIDWLIVGGESGKDHRPIEKGWVSDLREAAQMTRSVGVCARCVRDIGDCTCGYRHEGTAFFFKQWGGRTPKAGGRELDGRTWDEFPVSAEAVAA